MTSVRVWAITAPFSDMLIPSYFTSILGVPHKGSPHSAMVKTRHKEADKKDILALVLH